MAFEEIIIITIQLEEKCECCLYGSLFSPFSFHMLAAAADKPEKKSDDSSHTLQQIITPAKFQGI